MYGKQMVKYSIVTLCDVLRWLYFGLQ